MATHNEGYRCRAKRKELGLSAAGLAKEMECHVQAVKDFESGARRFSVKLAPAARRVLGLPLGVLGGAPALEYEALYGAQEG